MPLTTYKYRPIPQVMQTKRLKFALFGNPHQPDRLPAIQSLLQALAEHGCTVAIEQEFLDFLNRNLASPPAVQDCITSPAFKANYAISIGGDGTFLSTAALIGSKQIPILGINTGRLGFLADARADQAAQIVGSLLRGDYMIEKRSLLKTTLSQGNLSTYPVALNEVAILKHGGASMIDILCTIDGHTVATYQADGLLLSTPTGSTGYPLSVGGPIVRPTAAVVCITPVAPHSLNIRPLVVDDRVTIRLSISSRNGRYLASIDGRSQSLPTTTQLCIRKAPYTLSVVKMAGSNYFDTLREKLSWGITNTH